MTKRRKAYQERRNRPKAGKWLITSEKIAQDSSIASGEHLEMFIPYEGWEPAKDKTFADFRREYIQCHSTMDFVGRKLSFIERIKQSFNKWFKNNK